MPDRSGTRKIMVGPGDTTYSIAREMTGDGMRYPELVYANPRKRVAPSGMFESLTPGETLSAPADWNDAQGFEDAGAMGTLPYGWTQPDIQIVVELANAWDMDPEDLMAVWFSESGLQPHIERPNIGPGYYGLNMGWDAAMAGTAGWKPGTWINIVRNETTAVQLQALAKFYDAQAKAMLGESFAARARKLGMTPAGVLYGMNFVPAWAARMKTADQPMVRSAAAGGGAEEDSFYRSNPGFDITRKGYITMRDMDLRIARKRSEALSSVSPVRAVLLAARDKSDDPFVGLAKLFAPTSNDYMAVTGDRSPYVRASYGGGGGSSFVGDALVAAAGAFLVWKIWKG